MTEQQDRVTFDLRDEYQRRPIAEKIIQLLDGEIKVSPLVIDGSWGAGKTEFCHKLIHLIEDGETGLHPIYVDAFRADHADEPLMTLMAAVLKALPEKDREPLIKKALPAIKFGIKTTFKAGTSWILKQDAADLVDDYEDELKKAGDEVINHAIESLLTDHVVAEESISTLQSALRELAEQKPIVVFIDELDRCRPDFSVNMLESIKHVFEVDGVQFVLIANFDQLRSSVNHCYGKGLDAQRYLDRFVSFRFDLSETHKPNGHEAILASISHLKNLIANSELLKDSKLNERGLGDLLTVLVTENRLSLREVETFVLHLEIYQSLMGGKGISEKIVYGYGLLRILGVFLFCFKPSLSDDLSRGFVDGSAIANVMGKSRLFDHWDQIQPDLADELTALIGAESNCKDRSLVPSEDEQKKWNSATQYIFGHQRPYNELFTIISGTIETLRLNG